MAATVPLLLSPPAPLCLFCLCSRNERRQKKKEKPFGLRRPATTAQTRHGDHVVFHRTRGVTIELGVLQSFDTLVLASYWFTSLQRRNGGTPGPGKVDERKETKKKQRDKFERSTFISCTATLPWLRCKKWLQGPSAVYTETIFTHSLT